MGTGCRTERGGAGRRAPASLPRPSQVTDPAGPRPAPPHIQAARPGPSESSQRRRARSLCGPVRAWTRAPVLRDPAARHGRRGRPPQPPGAPPGARARPGADRKSRGRRHAGARVRGGGVRGAGPRRLVKGSACLPATLAPPCRPPRVRTAPWRASPRWVRTGARPGAVKGGGRAGEPEGPCPGTLGPAWDRQRGQELAPGPGSPESPGGGGDNGAHSQGSGASAPPPPRGPRLQPDAARARPLPLGPAPTPAPPSRC